MALIAENVSAAQTGAVMYAPLGTTAPTDPTEVWPAGWIDLGYVSEDGIVEAESRDWEEIKAWQNRAIVRRLLTDTEMTWQMTLIENKVDVLAVRHPGSTMTESGTAPDTFYQLDIMEPEEAFWTFGFDIVDGDVHHRILIPKGSITEVEDITYANGQAIGYGITIAAYTSGTGLVAIKMSDNIAWAPAP